jgi:hypothetical protein
VRWRTPGGAPSNTVRRWRGSRWYGVRAMAAGISLFLIGAMILVVPATSGPAGATPAPISSCANPPSTLAAGQVLSSGACLVSPAKDYKLVMQTDGNLVLYYQSSADPLWDSRTQTHPGAYAALQADGNLVVYAANGTTPLWATTTSGRAPNPNLVLQDDGNLVLYGANPGGSPFAAWSTATENLRGYELQENQVLEPGQYLESENGQYGLEMGAGGVLVLFRTENGNTQGAYRCPLWSEPAVTGADPVTYEYDTTNPIGTTVAQSTSSVGAYPYTDGDTTTETPSPNSYLTMQTDGNLVLYEPNFYDFVLWQSDTVTKSPSTGAGHPFVGPFSLNVYNPYLILQRWGTTASWKADPENVVPAVTTVATLTNSTAGSYVISGVHETLTNNTFSLQDALEKFGWL